MKLINAGLGRTGTTSLKVALEILGYSPVFHSTELFANAEQIAIMEDALKGKPTDWRAFFANYQVADWPVAFFYKDIINSFPEAKVMLTVRDPEQWSESLNAIAQQGRSAKHVPPPAMQGALRLIDNFYGGKTGDKPYMLRFYADYVEAVKAFVPADRLLIYNVTEGWEPLCKFLEVGKVPDQPFPRENTRDGLKDLLTRLNTSPTAGPATEAAPLPANLGS